MTYKVSPIFPRVRFSESEPSSLIISRPLLPHRILIFILSSVFGSHLVHHVLESLRPVSNTIWKGEGRREFVFSLASRDYNPSAQSAYGGNREGMGACSSSPATKDEAPRRSLPQNANQANAAKKAQNTVQLPA